MGHVNAPMMLGTLGVIEMALGAMGIPHGTGGVQAAIHGSGSRWPRCEVAVASVPFWRPVESRVPPGASDAMIAGAPSKS